MGLAALAGCGTTASIKRHDGRDIEGKIVGGDVANVYVRTAGGKPLPVPRESITDVDHPGNVLAIIGVVNALAGAVNAFALGACARHDSEWDAQGRATKEEVDTLPCAISVADMLLGATLAVIGTQNHRRSFGAFERMDYYPPASEKLPTQPLPEAPDGQYIEPSPSP